MLMGFREDGTALFSNGDPLTCANDNVLMSRLGAICKEAAKDSAGDYIDTGCALINRLNAAGFEVREKR